MCEYCDAKGGVYDMTRVCCIARYCLTLPTKEMARHTAERLAGHNGFSLQAILDEAKRQRDNMINERIGQ